MADPDRTAPPQVLTLTHAAAARSILACPASVEMFVDGALMPLAEEAPNGPLDWAGTPMLLCIPDGDLARAARLKRPVMLFLTSGVSEGETLTLTGTLRWAVSEACQCCDGMRDRVVVDLVDVLLERDGRQQQVAVCDFVDPALQLNAGYFRRSEEHLNRCHGADLRAAIATRTGVPIDDIVGVQIVRLNAEGVGLQWVTQDGARSTRLRFAKPAQHPEDLGLKLRRALHPGLC